MAEFLLNIDPRTLSPDQYRSKFQDFIEEYEFAQLQTLLLLSSPSAQHHSFLINYQDLVHYDSALGFTVLHHPALMLPILNEALMIVQFAVQKHPAFETKHRRKAQVKANCHVRLVSIPSVSDLSKPTIGDIRSHDVSSMIQITGTVVRTGGVRMLELSKQYECMNPKCRYRFTVTADPEQDHMLPQPRTCPSKADSSNTHFRPHTNRANSNPGEPKKEFKCNSSNLREIEGSRVCVDYQEIKVQDHIERLGLGSVPRSIVVILQADLVDRYNPGDDVVIVGTIVRRWRPVTRGVRCTLDIALEANSIVALNATEQAVSLSGATASEFEAFWRTFRDKDALFEARNVIVRSVCPQLYGMFYVKLALLLSLVGGSDTTRIGGGSGTGRGSGSSDISGGTGNGSASIGTTERTTNGSTTTHADARGSSSSTGNGGGANNTTEEDYDASRGVHRRSHIHMLMVRGCVVLHCMVCGSCLLMAVLSRVYF